MTPYKCGAKSVGGVIICLGKKNSTKVVPIYWKSKTIPQVCHAAKDAETRNLVKMVDDSVYLAKIIEEILYGYNENKCRISVKLFTDSKPTLESIASSKQVERKLMRNCITDLKEKLVHEDVESYSWLNTDLMVADFLTKENQSSLEMDNILLRNYTNVVLSNQNLVHFKNGEFKIENNTVKNSMEYS